MSDFSGMIAMAVWFYAIVAGIVIALALFGLWLAHYLTSPWDICLQVHSWSGCL